MSNKTLLIIGGAALVGILVGYSTEPTINSIVVVGGLAVGVYFLWPLLALA